MKATAKRRRTKVEIEEEKHNEESMKQDIDRKLALFHQMEQQNNQLQEQIQSNEHHLVQVQNMFDDGLMRQKDDGSFQIVENPLERIVLKREAEKRKSE